MHQARSLRVVERLLGCIDHRVHVRLHERNLPQRGVADVQSQVVVSGLERRHCLLGESRQVVGRALRLERDADEAHLDSRGQLAHAIARSRGPLGDGLGVPERVVASACPEQGVHEVVLEGDVDLGGWN